MGGVSITKGAKSTMSVTINKTEVSLQKTKNLSVEVIPTNNQKVVLDRGVAGQGVPVGGLAGQFLRKINGSNYSTEWYTLGTMSYQGSDNVTITGGTIINLTNLQSDFLQLDTSVAPTIALGKLRWNVTTNTASFGIIDGTVECNIGEQMYAYVTNAESVTILKGQPVYLHAAVGNRASVKLAGNTGDPTSAKTLGLATQDIAPNQTGFVTTQGVIEKINTGTFAEGDTLYLGSTVGTLTNVKPKAPNHLVYMGVVERANNGNGQIYVKPQNGYELDELHDVLITNPVTNDILRRNGSGLWINYQGASGSFRSQDGKTITVVGGLITSIV